MIVPFFIVGASVLGVIYAVCVFRMLSFAPESAKAESLDLQVENKDRYGDSLSKMIQIPTVSAVNQETQNIETFIAFLRQRYPKVHEALEVINLENSLLFYWKGSKQQKRPVCFMAHMDVVEAKGHWEQEPFSGHRADGLIWGRGTVDTKNSLCAILEAAEELVESGFTPQRDIYFSFGKNEEVTGNGARLAVDYFKDRGIRLDFVLDEGGAIVDNPPLPGVKGPCALIGIMEKGYGDIKFIARSNGGHSSMPPKNNPIARLMQVVHLVEKSSFFTAKLSAPMKNMLEALAPHTPFFYRFLFSNLWLFGPLICAVMKASSPQAAAMLKTTCVFTAMQGSDGYNVLPQEAWMVANTRFMPHQDKDETLARLQALAAKYDIETQWIHGNPASAVSDVKSHYFSFLANTLYRGFSPTCVVPYIMTGGTDSRYFCAICDTVLRFSPFEITMEQMRSCHGKNENLSVASLNKAVACYRYLLRKIGEEN